MVTGSCDWKKKPTLIWSSYDAIIEAKYGNMCH